MTTNPEVLRLARKPRRRIEATLRISADSWRDLQGALRCLETEIAQSGRLSASSVSGGYSFGWIVETSEDESITHDSWAAELHEYLDHLRQSEKDNSDAD